VVTSDAWRLGSHGSFELQVAPNERLKKELFDICFRSSNRDPYWFGGWYENPNQMGSSFC